MSDAAAVDLQRHVEAIDAEGGGLLRLHFFAARDGARLLLAAAAGDHWSLVMLAVISDCVRQIETAPKRAPTLCLVCPHELRSVVGATFCISAPDAAMPHHVLGSAICPRCAAHADIEARATVALRRIWPDLREIRPVSGSGTVQ